MAPDTCGRGSTRRSAFLLAVALLSTLVLAGTRPAPSVLRVIGAGSGSATLHLTEAISIDRGSHTTPRMVDALDVSGTTDFAGVVLQPFRGGEWVLLYVTDALGSRAGGFAQWSLAEPSQPLVLEPGRYDVHLLTDAATVFEIAVSGPAGEVEIRTEPATDVGFVRGRDDTMLPAHVAWSVSDSPPSHAMTIDFAWVWTTEPQALRHSFLCHGSRQVAPGVSNCRPGDVMTSEPQVLASGGVYELVYPRPEAPYRSTFWNAVVLPASGEVRAGLLRAWWPFFDDDGRG